MPREQELVCFGETLSMNEIEIMERRMLRVLEKFLENCSWDGFLLNFEVEAQEMNDVLGVLFYSQKGVEKNINLDYGLVTTHVQM